MSVRPLVYSETCKFAFPEPAPEGYEATTATIVDSARNLNGYVTGAVIRHHVSKINLTWNALKPEEWAAVLSCFDRSFYNTITFYDQDSAGWITKEMYVNDRTASMWLRDAEDGSCKRWVKAKLALIER